MSVQTIPVVTVAYNTPALLQGMLQSLRRHYANPVLVIDGSDAQHQAQIAAVAAGFEGITLHTLGYNIHHGPGMAWAVQHLGLSGPVLFLDTDIVILRDGFLQALLAELRPGDYGVGGVAAVNQDGFDVAGGEGAVPYLHPPCMLCNVEVMREWPLPVKHGAPMVEAMKALHRAGKSSLLRHLDWAANDVLMGTRKVYVDHIGKGTSTATGSYNLDEWMAEVQAQRARAALMSAAPAAPAAAHDNGDLLALLPLTSKRVLQVGCSSGSLARAFKTLNPGCDYRAMALDENADANAAAGTITTAHQARQQAAALDIETLSERDFAGLHDRDCWVFDGVLERLREPWTVLARIRKIMPADGCVVACVSNAQHWRLQARLAVGDFHYSGVGLLDRSQLRWFTRLSLLQLFSQAGFKLDHGLARTFNEPQREQVLPAIRAMAVCQGLNPEQAVQDALALHYVVRMVPA